MNYHLISTNDCMKKLNTTINGLSFDEAQKRLTKYGKNKLILVKNESIIKSLFSQMSDPMIIMLIVAAFISFITSFYTNENTADVIIITLVVLINSILSVYQKQKAHRSIEALQKISSVKSKVIRNKTIILIPSEDLVVGDIVLLEAGDIVPADGRLLECTVLKIDESALTGKSTPVSKVTDTLTVNNSKTTIHDIKNMVFMGSTIVYGRSKFIVTATGMKTEMGKIADTLRKTITSKTSLQLNLAQLSKIITSIVIVVSVIVFAIGLVQSETISSKNIINTLMISVSLAVAAIPEGLVAVVTIVLSIGVIRISKKNAIINKLSAVETIGCAEVICFDKTGTLTQNKMTVVDYQTNNLDLLAKIMSLCSDAEYDSRLNKAIGEPMESALVKWASNIYVSKDLLQRDEPRIGEIPFDSNRKMMTTLHKSNNIYYQYTKGAPDEIIKKCTSIFEDGKQIPIDKDTAASILKISREMGKKALRVLIGAYKTYDALPENLDDLPEDNLCYVGVIGLIDLIRPEVKDAIKKCSDAGIRVVLITGDYIETAWATANELGIISKNGLAITGSKLDSLSDKEFEDHIKDYCVYARVRPEHKTRIVNVWKKAGFVTAMTGDGANDAPSIKSADIGIGMGTTGTDITKKVADMVLTDDNFATIISAVEEGRRIYDNIKKSVKYLLSCNISEVISIFIATLLGFTLLKPIHLLWINLVTDCFPALALGNEPAEDDIMKKSTRKKADKIFNFNLAIDVIYQGVFVTILTMTAYVVGHYIETGIWEFTNSADGTTMAFLTMSMAEILHSFNMRSQKNSVFTLKKNNKGLLFAGIASFLLTTSIIYIPIFAKAFQFTSIHFGEYIFALVLAFMIIPMVEGTKLIQRLLIKNDKIVRQR